MGTGRLDLAFAEGAPEGRLLVIGAKAGDDLSMLAPARTTIVQPQFADHRALGARGFHMATEAAGPADAALVVLPRAKALARARIADAASHLPEGADLWIDGQRTDGVESILRDLRALTEIHDLHSKAHGKIFRVRTGPWLPADWTGQDSYPAPGFRAPPGAFSADGVDPASAALAAALPSKMPTWVVDLGAGWGWLSARVLAKPGVEVLHLIEADHAAVEAARANVTDPRARFHWADARDVALPDPVNGVVMNPPFHEGRAADPSLGRAFIATAARLLTQAGTLWMVANRHLPYEATLSEHFARVTETGGDARFKIIEATGARRDARSRSGRKVRA
ncbi:methyltransferase [Paracoccus sp. TK19116]|uniref:Methyltransferase n=1 Tax=Paracoccus albicereus TaxID=2922394 RepID=A0ABT1MP99_9RHOB|nr:methyltransferase [Paracoccus albicereus]MCQ0969939.1 methyltransferase [Paracoccus albicereus]